MASLAVAMWLATPAWAGTPLPDSPHIVVTGSGKVSVAPDQVRVSAQFEARDPQPLAAKRSVDEAVGRYLAILGDFAISKPDIEAGSLSSYEQVFFHEGKRVSNGFVAQRNVTVVLKNLDQLNRLIDGGLAAGANTVSPLKFESAREEALLVEAKAKAAEDARSKAEQVAHGFGARLGPVYSIDSLQMYSSVSYNSYAPPAAAPDVGASVAPYFQPSIDYTQSVQVVFELRR
jgi:uncharacterized protein YggE